jgi:ribosomal protein S18 acetylase RimI-like enzyme
MTSAGSGNLLLPLPVRRTSAPQIDSGGRWLCDCGRMDDAGSFAITRGGPEDIDALGPLWVGVHAQHQASMPELAPYVTAQESWAARRALYHEVFAKPGTVLLLARAGAELVGYGLAHVLETKDTWIADTWRRGDRVGEIESLAVVPGRRGEGIGTALLDLLEAELRAIGVEDLILGVLAGNIAAQRLYARHGYRPTWLYMSRGAADVSSPGLSDL